MSSGLEISGVDRVKARLLQARAKGRVATQTAMEEAIAFVMQKARDILDAEIYNAPREEGDEAPNKGDADALYNSFVQDLGAISSTVADGKLFNTSDHALFLEDGTDEEGTGKHFVAVKNAGALGWMNPATGEMNFSKGHEVSGIKPIRFLARALRENKAEVIAIFKKHYAGLMR